MRQTSEIYAIAMRLAEVLDADRHRFYPFAVLRAAAGCEDWETTKAIRELRERGLVVRRVSLKDGNRGVRTFYRHACSGSMAERLKQGAAPPPRDRAEPPRHKTSGGYERRLEMFGRAVFYTDENDRWVDRVTRTAPRLNYATQTAS